MNEDVILEKIAHLNENLNDDFFALNKKIDDHIKRYDQQFKKQEELLDDFSEKFNTFRGGILVAGTFVGILLSLMCYIYKSDIKRSDSNDAIHAQMLKDISDTVIQLKYKGKS